MLTSGCSNAPDPGTETAGTGTIDLPLTAQADGVQYRLAKAKFKIQGVDVKLTRTITPAADLPVDQEILPSGNYQITLADGWQLQAKGPSDSSFTTVDAELAVDNPLYFTVTRSTTVDVVFVFISRGIPIKLSKGRADVRISVSDCSQFNSYAAAIASYTLDCTGRIDQNSFLIDDNGFLARNFNECAGDDQSLLQSIDDFLGLQFPDGDPVPYAGDGNPIAYAQDCIAGRWAAWRESFEQSGNTVCPDWVKAGVINEPTLELYDKFAAALPELPVQEDGSRPGVVNDMKINAIYTTSFPNGQPDQRCGSAGNCAAACAGGFPGLVIGQDGDAITTDPPPWESNVNYPDPNDSTTNPFMRTSYYHPMSFYGALPGDLFGARPRANGDAKGNHEACSYYANGTHNLGSLQLNCRTAPDGVTQACVSVCSPPILQ